MKLVRPLTVALLLAAAPAAAAEPPPAPHAHSTGHDDRVALALEPDERAMILAEMRAFLDGVQQLTAALAREDMPAAAKAARALGPQLAHEVPPALRAKLPADFRQLGSSVHRDFAQIALDAETLQDARHSLGQLSATLRKCVACHATYRIDAPVAGGH